VAEAMSPYKTGATYINFLELDGASPERVRAAYSREDWERLVELKDHYDPENLFRFNRNIPPSSTGE
jgi:FAD/FMN-containing dehydrogenase